MHATSRGPASTGPQSSVTGANIPGTKELLERATSAAPQHSSIAVHAWRLYGDWLYSQHDTAGAAASAAPLRAAEAYCQAVSHAAGSASAGDTMSALLRILQASALFATPLGHEQGMQERERRCVHMFVAYP